MRTFHYAVHVHVSMYCMLLHSQVPPLFTYFPIDDDF
jgi:hypothetical protein